VHEVHKFNETETNTQECWVIIKGRVLAKLYDIDTSLLASIELSQGDAVITLRGGHNYLSLEDGTIAYEVKSGPYNPITDKRRF
jgi:cupin fold WbuC family metalloprotein